MIAQVIRAAMITMAVTALIPTALILSQRPTGPLPAGEATAPGQRESGLDFSGVALGPQMPEPEGVEMRDGYPIQVRSYRNGPGPLVVMIHGSGWNGLQFAALAPQISGHVLVPDLRGHGALPGRRGDVDYVGQLEDDLADLIRARAEPGQPVVLLGHSSGGGLVVRFAGGDHRALISRAVLLAPFLKYNAPTTRRNSGGWARPLTRRIIGLSMLNALGVTWFNHVTAVEFNMPAKVLEGPLGALATTGYSYRLNTSFAPRADYLQDIAALPAFLLVAGQKDEAFVADAYQPLMSAVNDRGQYLGVPDTGHLGIVDATETAAAIKEFLSGL